MALTVAVDRPRADAAVVAASGWIDAATAGDFEAAVKPLADDVSVLVLVIDMKGVSYVASAGLRVFLAAIKALRTRKGRLAIADPDPEVEKILKSSGILMLAKRVDSVEEGL